MAARACFQMEQRRSFRVKKRQSLYDISTLTLARYKLSSLQISHDAFSKGSSWPEKYVFQKELNGLIRVQMSRIIIKLYYLSKE